MRFPIKNPLAGLISVSYTHLDVYKRQILRNEATHHEADMSRLIIPEDGETVVL